MKSIDNTPLTARFWAVIGHRLASKSEDAVGGCRIWTAKSKTNGGYGILRIAGRSTMAHRAAYERAYGPIPYGLVIDHKCRVRACINPVHLEAVTHRENDIRGAVFRVVACPKGHIYDQATTDWQSGRQGRRCRVCHRADTARRRAERARQ